MGYNYNMVDSKKAAIILIYKVLEEYSDENHYLTQQEIIDKVKRHYGLELERRTVSSDINLLIDLECDIEKSPKGGYALLSRKFDNSEISFLTDAIFSSKAIPGKQAKHLTDKLSSFLSIYDRRNFKYLYKSTEINRTTNNEIFLNTEIINEAIERGKNICFQYVGYDENGKQCLRFNGYEYQVSPYYLINNFGRYYLLGYRRRKPNTNIYRLDYMRNLRIDETRDIIPITELEEYKNGFSISKYINDHIYLFDGKLIEATLKLKGPYAIAFIEDWFGKNARILKKDDGLYAKVKCNENGFFYWIMQYSEHFTVISPQSIIDRIKLNAEELLKKYE